MRYELQHLEPIAVYQGGRKCNTYTTTRWKGKLLSDNRNAFKEYEGLKNYRIFDRGERKESPR